MSVDAVAVTQVAVMIVECTHNAAAGLEGNAYS